MTDRERAMLLGYDTCIQDAMAEEEVIADFLKTEGDPYTADIKAKVGSSVFKSLGDHLGRKRAEFIQGFKSSKENGGE